MSAARNHSELLAGTSLFGALDAQLRDAVAAEMREVRYQAGQSIFERGDPGTEIYLVLEGRVRLSVLTVDGRELSFAHAAAGDVFGEIAALDGGSRSASATALTDVGMMLLTTPKFQRLIDDQPALARAAINLLCARLRDVSNHLEDIALFSVEARLARFLLHELSMRGTGTTPVMSRLVLGMSQSELALLLGASRPKVNSALIALEEAGAIKRIGQNMECDPGSLTAFARLE